VRGALQGAALDHRPYPLQLLLCGLQQGLTFMPAQPSQFLVAARHQALARVIRMGEFEQVPCVKEPQLECPAFHQGANLRALQRRDPRQPRMGT